MTTASLRVCRSRRDLKISPVPTNQDFADFSTSIETGTLLHYEILGCPVMRAHRKIIVYIATSADGYIARPNGDVEWLNRLPSKADYGMNAFYRTIDTVLWGRKTYDWLLSYYKKKGKKAGMFDTNLTNYVFSSKPPKRPAPGVEFVSKPVKAFAQHLRATPGKHIWMMGGGKLIASFLDADEIDEFDIHVVPTFIGEGIPLVAPRHRDIALRLRSARKYPDGVVRLRYEVAR